MTLRERALKAYEEQAEQDRINELRRQQERYESTLLRSTNELMPKLKEILGVEPDELRAMLGPNHEGIAVYIEDGLAFTMFEDFLRVHEVLTEPQAVYPVRAYWRKVATLADVGKVIKEMGPPKGGPTGKAQAV